jgi:hypothetical protein
MSFEPDPLQRLLFWRLAVAEGGGDFLKEIKPTPDTAKRRPLVREGYLVEEKRRPPKGGRPVTYLELTEKGWAWCQTHLEAELSRSALSTFVLQRLLGLLKNYFENQTHTVSLGQFIQQARASRPAPAAATAEGNGRAGDLEQTIRWACLDLGHGRENVRIRLADLRSRLRDVSESALDGKLLEMEREGKLSLYGLDNPQEIRSEDRQAAIRTTSGHERHILYFGGRAS